MHLQLVYLITYIYCVVTNTNSFQRWHSILVGLISKKRTFKSDNSFGISYLLQFVPPSLWRKVVFVFLPSKIEAPKNIRTTYMCMTCNVLPNIHTE